MVGRGDLLERFDVALDRLENGRSAMGPLITGPRGSGKTAVLNALAAHATSRGWFVAGAEVIPGTPLSDLVAVIAHEVLDTMSRGNRTVERVKRALGVLKAFTAVSALGVSLSIDVDAVRGTADSGILAHDLRRLLVEISELARLQKTGVLFYLDEVHALNQTEFSGLNSALYLTAQLGLPITLASAGLFPSWQSGVHGSRGGGDPERASTVEVRTLVQTFTRLTPLQPADARLMLAETARSEGARFEAAALNAVVTYCEGNCWMLQLAGELMWELSASPLIGADAAFEAIRQIEHRFDQVYFPRLLQACTPDEVALLRQIAQLESSQVTLAMIRPGAQRDPHVRDATARALLNLSRQDLIVLDSENLHTGSFSVGFSVPRLEAYLVRRATGASPAVVDAARARPKPLAWRERAGRAGGGGRLEDPAVAAQQRTAHSEPAPAQAEPDPSLPALALSLTNLSISLGEAGQAQESLAAISEAAEIYRRLAAAAPSVHRPDLAVALHNLSLALAKSNRRQDALAAAAETVEILRALAAEAPETHRPRLADGLYSLAYQLWGASAWQDALISVAEAVAIYRELAAAAPTTHRPNLALSLHDLSLALGMAGRRQESLDAMSEAVAINRELATARRPSRF